MNHKQIKKLIDTTLKKMHMWSEEAVELVFLTGLVESGYDYIYQIGSGIARSFWQVESFTAKDCVDNYLVFRNRTFTDVASALQRDVKEVKEMSQEDLHELLWHDIVAGIVFCRLKYRRVPTPIPNDIEGLARYWKDHYNTESGAGTISHFLEMSETRKDK
jgi:hypothetical protein|tara:strand:+ start:518 stop:1000 length:483 start_codon:yes stop_codon:yes gene_type:complete